MGYRLGISKDGHQPDSLFEPGVGGQLVRRANVYPVKPSLNPKDWDKIVGYYLKNAPDSLKSKIQGKEINKKLRHFVPRVPTNSKKPPMTIMAKILPGNMGLVYSDEKKNISSLNFVENSFRKDYSVYLRSTPVDLSVIQDTLYVTTIGTKMYPHDAPNGAVQKIYRATPDGPFKSADLLIPNLQRPVFTEYSDLNNDGLLDVVICEYGNLTGKLSWYQNMGNNNYQMSLLNANPGACMVRLRDVDNDGYMDIFALMAQGDEGIFLYRNNGNGTFQERRILSFLPLFGSQYFDMIDFNGDGMQDIIYVCGDNADLSPILKDYHGIYIYINQGGHQYKQAYYYHLNGAYKAVPNDYDLDGDLDIAAISFFPDYTRYPEEGFVYLENKGGLQFEGSSFPGVNKGRWIVMDTKDMDADGDIDIVLGSFVGFSPIGDTTSLHEKWLNSGPSLLILENTIRK